MFSDSREAAQVVKKEVPDNTFQRAQSVFVRGAAPV